MRSTTRVGVIGCGTVACWAHLPALRRMRNVRLVCAADPSEEARARAVRWVPELHADAADLLARDDVDAVVVAVPSHLHARVAVEALEAGRHVYLEKPLALTPAEGRRVAEAARTADTVLAVGLNRREHPSFRRARALVADGRIGAVRAIQSVFCESAVDGMPRWKRSRRTGGGVLPDLATHHADLVRWITGQALVEGGGAARDLESEEDEARVWWRTEEGVEVHAFFSYRAATVDRMTLVGQRGVIHVDRHRFRVELEVARPGAYRPRPRFVAAGPGELLGRLGSAAGVVRDPSYRRALAAFVEGIRGDPARPAPAGPEDGLHALGAVAMVRGEAGP